MLNADVNRSNAGEIQNAVESVIWTGRPSQLVNLGSVLISTGLCGALLVATEVVSEFNVIPEYPLAYIMLGLLLIYLLYRWLLVRFEIKVVTTKRIKIRKSIWNSGMRPVQLFRVKDHDYDEPWYWKPFGLGTVTLQTSDHSDPIVKIRAIKRARELHDRIERLVVQERRDQGVQEIDYKV
jgi:membrane protein YdbS with pleckstrin-like domain